MKVRVVLLSLLAASAVACSKSGGGGSKTPPNPYKPLTKVQAQSVQDVNLASTRAQQAVAYWVPKEDKGQGRMSLQDMTGGMFEMSQPADWETQRMAQLLSNCVMDIVKPPQDRAGEGHVTFNGPSCPIEYNMVIRSTMANNSATITMQVSYLVKPDAQFAEYRDLNDVLQFNIGGNMNVTGNQAAKTANMNGRMEGSIATKSHGIVETSMALGANFSETQGSMGIHLEIKMEGFLAVGDINGQFTKDTSNFTYKINGEVVSAEEFTSFFGGATTGTGLN